MYDRKILRRVLKPGRYSGGEYGQIVKNPADTKCSFVFCFPDTYEIGMSNLGVRLLYGALNAEPDVRCERAYAPWVDMEAELRAANIPLQSHENGQPLGTFDIVGFTLQYELNYTNVLNMLELGKIPLLANERGEEHPIVIGGGPCAYNAEPVADFFDIFSIGEGEEALVELARLYINMKESGSYTREAFKREASHLAGFYVPSLYDISYNSYGTISAIEPKYPDVPARVTKRIIADFDNSFFPEMLVMPYIECVHDRIMLETFRGCIRGCRFCQAGMIFRPVREKKAETLDRQARELYKNTGYDEISLSALSISDYSQLPELTDMLLSWTDKCMVNLSLPSLRIDSFSEELMKKVDSVLSSGLTFAPEAGTQRMRDVINKNVTEEDLLNACQIAFRNGKNQIKLYFMNGLPTETHEDIDGIAKLADSVVSSYYRMSEKPRSRPPQVTISVACFVPKPFTPFQWEPQDTLENLREKQKHLGDCITNRKNIRYTWHDARVSHVEAVFARGDRRLSRALLEARKLDLKFDGWDEHFDFDKWMKAFKNAGIDPAFYANREFGRDEILPWDMIDIGVTKEFLLRENDKAHLAKTTPSCREKCSGCGANRLFDGDDSQICGRCCP